MRDTISIICLLALGVCLAGTSYVTHKANVRVEEAIRSKHNLAYSCYQTGWQRGRIAMMQEVIHQPIKYPQAAPEECNQ